VADSSLLVYHECNALRHAEDAQHTIEFRSILLRVAKQRELQPELLREALVGGFTVDADAEDLSLSLFEQGETSLVRLEFLRSGRGVGKHVEREDNIPLAAKIGKPDAITVVIRQLEIWRRITDVG
jgi:hypothetical protein